MIRDYYSGIMLYPRYFFNPLNSLPAVARSMLDYYITTRQNFPINVNLALTSKCNNKCYMCCERQHLNKGAAELGTGDILRLAQEVRKYRSLFFLTGGEPFMRKDTMEIVRHLKKLGVHTGICTNGVLIGRHLRQLAKLDIDNIVFSIHGAGKAHDAITGVRGSYEECLRNLRRFSAIKKNTHIMVNSCILPENIHTLHRLMKAVADNGADSIRFQHLMYMKPGGPNVVNQFRYEQDISGLVPLVRRLMRAQNRIPVLFNPFLRGRELYLWYSHDFSTKRKCMYLWQGILIRAEGSVVPCQNYDLVLGNIREQSLYSIYNSNNAVKFRKRVKKGLLPGCARCCKL